MVIITYYIVTMVEKSARICKDAGFMNKFYQSLMYNTIADGPTHCKVEYSNQFS